MTTPTKDSNPMTERAELLDALNIAFAQKYHSMAQYVLDAEPYIKAGQERLLPVIGDLAAMDHEAMRLLAEAIESREGIAQPGVMDPQFSTLNYLDLDYLANALYETLERQKSYYEGMRQRFGSDPDAQSVFAMLCSTTTEQLSRLRAARD
ncbi:hypothetical protein LLG95_07160 [bacterium]|nr:hypothetical protein [bacterium]